MPALNPSVVLSSPMLSGETVDVERRVQQVNDRGRASVEVVPFPKVRAIVYTEGRSSKRDPEATRGEAALTVICNFRLQSLAMKPLASADYMPDIVIWKGGRYLVTETQDYTDYGPGWVEATCKIDTTAQPRTGG